MRILTIYFNSIVLDVRYVFAKKIMKFFVGKTLLQFNACYLQFTKTNINQNHIVSVMVHLLYSNAVDRGISCFSANNLILSSKRKDGLTRN